MAHLKIYRCDVCGKDVEDSKALKPIYVEWGPIKGGGRYNRGRRDGVRVDVCVGSCVTQLGDALLPFIGVKGRNALIPSPPPPKLKAVPPPKVKPKEKA